MRKISSRKITIFTYLLLTALIFASCQGSSVKPSEETKALSFNEAVMQYLGDYCYTGDEAAFVYEAVEGDVDENGDQFYGIQYREIKDLPALLQQKDFPVLIYFYSSQMSDTGGMTAGAEDLAQTLSGRVLTISVDALSHKDIAGRYEIVGLPEFVLLENGTLKSVFESSEKSYWDMNDVVDWITSCGYAPDTGKLV